MLAAALLASAAGLGSHGTPLDAAPTANVERALESASRSADRVATPIVVTIVDGEQTTTLKVDPTLATVGEALADTGAVTLTDDDLMSPAPSAALPDGDFTVTVTRAMRVGETEDVAVPHTSRTVEDPNRPAGSQTVIQDGVDGASRKTYEVLRDAHGTELSRELVVTTEVPAVEEVIAVGTKAKPVPAAPAGTGATVEPGTARAIAREQVAAHGWGDGEFACLDALWQRESGWRVNAANPSSSAYGIPQALPGSKMASAGADWATNPATQIAWGLKYISGRYATPCGAWGHSQSHGWY